MKSVLISNKPRWCAEIARGWKEDEVRKTKPNLPTPFKVLIYCTKPNTTDPHEILEVHATDGKIRKANGKVFAEFICDRIDSAWGDRVIDENHKHKTCLSDVEIADYIEDKTAYFWHISNLVIYDQPKELTKFIVPSKFGCVNEGKCRGCIYLDRGNGYNVEDDCNAWFSTDDYKPLRKPPQSWCYVEERSEQ